MLQYSQLVKGKLLTDRGRDPPVKLFIAYREVWRYLAGYVEPHTKDRPSRCEPRNETFNPSNRFDSGDSCCNKRDQCRLSVSLDKHSSYDRDGQDYAQEVQRDAK